MREAEEALEKTAVTFEKYRKNKKFVLPEDLAGKYRKSFDRLKQQLKAELEEYLRLAILGGLQVLDDSDGKDVIREIDSLFKKFQVGIWACRAVFQEFDLEKAVYLAWEQRQRVLQIYQRYFDRHTCLYAAGPSWDLDDPQPPLIYNSIIDAFFDETTGKWVKKEKPQGAAILIFVMGE